MAVPPSLAWKLLWWLWWLWLLKGGGPWRFLCALVLLHPPYSLRVVEESSLNSNLDFDFDFIFFLLHLPSFLPSASPLEHLESLRQTSKDEQRLPTSLIAGTILTTSLSFRIRDNTSTIPPTFTLLPEINLINLIKSSPSTTLGC